MEEINTSPNIQLEYNKRLSKLQNEFVSLKKNSKWKFDPQQQAIFSFVTQRLTAITFQVSSYNVTLKVGNKNFGFMHLLLRHYGENCDGSVTALDILKIGNVIRANIELTANKSNRKKFIQNKNGECYTVILEEKSPNDLVFTFYSSK